MADLTAMNGSDDWWLDFLGTKLGANFPRLDRLRSYREGTAEVPDQSNREVRDAYARFVNMSRLNFAELIVAFVVAHEQPLGFRTAAPNDAQGDAVAMGIWKGSHMPVQARDLFDDKGTYGESFLTVTGALSADLSGAYSAPLIVRSSPWNTAVEMSPVRPWEVESAITVGYNPYDQADFITLFRRGYFRQAVRAAKGNRSSIPSNGRVWQPGRGWSWVDDPQPYGYTDGTPVIRFATPGGVGEFERHTDSLDRINHTIHQRLTITAMQAFRQLALSGKLPEVYPPSHPQAGQKIDYNEIYKAGPGAMWMLPEGAKVWESGVTDIRPIIEASKEDLRNLAAVSSTPIYALAPDAANGSAEGASLARETGNFKAEDRIERDGDSLSLALGFAFQALRDTQRADTSQISTIWRSVDRDSKNARATAAAAAKQAGMSQAGINEFMFGLTPDEIAREEQNKNDEMFAQATNA